MSAGAAAGTVRAATRERVWPAVGIVGVAVLAGLAAGDPSPLWWTPLLLVAIGATLYATLRWPFVSLLIMLGSTILLVVVRAIGLRSVNLIDVLMPQVLAASLWGRAPLEAAAHPESGALHDRLTQAERRFTGSVLLFYGLAALSLVQLAMLSGVPAALDSGLLLVRALQGLLFYPLCTLWLRTPERIRQAWGAIVLAGLALAVVNLVGVSAWGVSRAGMTFFLNNWDAPLSTPNEAGTATLIVAVVLLIRQTMRPDWRNLALGAVMVVTLGLTQSRSGMLAWLTFALFTLRWVRPSRLLTGALAIAALLPLLPQSFWIRMARSVVVERGTFEAASFFQRVYGWKVAWRVYLDHPWTGVGYLGFRFVSHAYNELNMVFGTVENYFYEILVSMGPVGLLALGVVIVRLIQLGREVGRLAPAGTLAHHMSRFHTPLLLGLLVANMTADNFMGTLSLAQLALWTAVLVRSAHAAVTERGSA